MPLSATIVRPTPELGERILEALSEVGFNQDDVEVVPQEHSDEEVVASLRPRPEHLLVLPFRQPLRQGTRTNGVDLLQRLEKEAPKIVRIPVLMLATVYSAAQVRLLLGDANPDETLTKETRHRILVVQEEALTDPKSLSLLRMHLRLHAGR